MESTKSTLLNSLMHICFLEKFPNISFTILEHSRFELKEFQEATTECLICKEDSPLIIQDRQCITPQRLKLLLRKLSEIQMLPFNLLLLHSVLPH